MKKMKRIAATLLCLGLAIGTLSACSNGNSGDQPAEEPTTKQTESVTEAVTDATTEETTAATETTAETPEGDVIIPLYSDAVTGEMVSMVDPVSFLDFDKYSAYFHLTPVNYEPNINGTVQLYTFDYGESFEIKKAPIVNDNSCYTMTLYIARSVDGVPEVDNNEIGIFYQVEEYSSPHWWIVPICFNQTKGCLVGYSVNTEEGTFKRCEWYYSSGESLGVAPISDADYLRTYSDYF